MALGERIMLAAANADQSDARTVADTLETMYPQFPPADQGLEKVSIPD